MANSISQTQIANASLSGSGGVDLVYLTNPGFSVRVTNVSGVAPIYFTVDHPGGPCPVPTVGGQSCYVVPAGIGLYVSARNDFLSGAIIQLTSASVVQYSAQMQGVRVGS